MILVSPRLHSQGAPGWGRWSQTQREVPYLQGRTRSGRDRDWRGQGGDKGSVQNSKANPSAEWALALGMEGQWEKGVLGSEQSITKLVKGTNLELVRRGFKSPICMA